VGAKLDTASHFTDDVERHHLGGQEFGTCKGCGYHVCSCKPRECSFETLQTAFGELKVIADPRVPPGAIYGIKMVERPCFVCGRQMSAGEGAACHACVSKADAEAKPFRDAMDAKIKALMGLMPYASYELLAAALDEDKT
jgi:hypothetical protein